MKITEFKRIEPCSDCGELISSQMYKIKIGDNIEFCLCEDCLDKLCGKIIGTFGFDFETKGETV